MFNIFGKIKDLIIAALALAIPVIYVVARMRGKDAYKKQQLENEVKTSKKVQDFYKNMANDETDNLTDRSSVTDRLRKNGL
jgi:uncharacterized membrane-anchored protein YhcB (DUF1043 family)